MPQPVDPNEVLMTGENSFIRLSPDGGKTFFSARSIGAIPGRVVTDFDRDGLSFELAAPVIRERLSADRRTELIRDWTADLRRRTAVVELWK